MISFLLLLLSLSVLVAVVQAHPSDMSCSTSSTWNPGQPFNMMGIASYSLSTVACTLEISPQLPAEGFAPNQVFTVTLQATQALGMKAVLVGNGAIVLSAGSGGSLAAQSTCINYNSRATSRTFTFRAPQSGTVIIRGLCGGNREAMYVAQQLVLTAQIGDGNGGGVPPPATPPSRSGDDDDENDDEDDDEDDEDDEDDGFAGIRLSSALVAHIAVTLIAFGFLIPWTVSIALFSNASYVSPKSHWCCCSRLSYNTWVSLHFACALVGLLLGTAGFATGFVTQTSHDHLTSTHSRLGLAVFVLLGLQVLAGVTRAVWKRFFPQIHALLGYSLVAVAVTTLLFGVVELEDYTNGLPYSFNGITGEVGFNGPLGIAVVVICAVQLALIAAGLLLRLVTRQLNGNYHNSPESSAESPLNGKTKTMIRMSKVLASSHLFVYRDLVVDVELFAKQHPGGQRVFTMLHGKDITGAFEQQGHSASAVNKLHSLIVGTVGVDVQNNQLALDGASPTQALPATFLMGPTVRRTVKIAQKTALTHNVSEFTLQYAEDDLPLGLPIGKHILIFGLDVRNGEEFQRKYTPTEHGLGWFKLVIKINPTGRMGSMLQLCAVGDTLEIAGPVGLEEYLGEGRFKRYSSGAIRFTNIVFVAGGSGITPCYQIALEIMHNLDDNTMVYLLACNSTVQDVILQRELEDLQRRFPKKFKLWFTVSQPPPSSQYAWCYSVGRISPSSMDILDKYRSLPKSTTLVITCGPKSFTECTKVAFEQELGFPHVMEY